MSDAIRVTVTMARPGLVALSCFVLLYGASTAATLVLPETRGTWIMWSMIAFGVIMTLVIATSARIRVVVDERGLDVTSWMGWPRTRVPASEVTDVRVISVDPFAEFGGWGWRRVLGKTTGIVLREGSALRVTRASGRILVVTMDSAQEAAALLNEWRVSELSKKGTQEIHD